jgi:hypothetical protein
MAKPSEFTKRGIFVRLAVLDLLQRAAERAHDWGDLDLERRIAILIVEGRKEIDVPRATSKGKV